VLQRREGALATVGALAQPAADADLGRSVGALEIEPVGVDQLVRMRDVAAEPDRELRGRCVPAGVLPDALTLATVSP
jgi:hypothetical protein